MGLAGQQEVRVQPYSRCFKVFAQAPVSHMVRLEHPVPRQFRVAWPVDVRWCAAKLKDDVELVDVILAAEQRPALDHLGQDAPDTPHVYRWAVSLRDTPGRPTVSADHNCASSGGSSAPLILAGAPAVGTTG